MKIIGHTVAAQYMSKPHLKQRSGPQTLWHEGPIFPRKGRGVGQGDRRQSCGEEGGGTQVNFTCCC